MTRARQRADVASCRRFSACSTRSPADRFACLLDRVAAPVEQVRENHVTARAQDERLRPDPLQHLLEMPDVSGADPQQGVRVSCDRHGCDDLGMPADRLGDPSWAARLPAVDLDVRLGVPAKRAGVEDGGIAHNGAAGPEPIDPTLHRGRGQANDFSNVGKALAGVSGQHRHDAPSSGSRGTTLIMDAAPLLEFAAGSRPKHLQCTPMGSAPVEDIHARAWATAHLRCFP